MSVDRKKRRWIHQDRMGMHLGLEMTRIHSVVSFGLNNILFVTRHVYRGSYMSAHVLLNLLNELGEKR